MQGLRERCGIAADWLEERRRVAAGTLVQLDGSGPLSPGATMLVDEDGTIEGSVTGGCVEGAVVVECQEVLAGGAPRVVTYGISDELAGSVGLTCGGTVHIFVRDLSADLVPVLRAVAAGESVGVATLIDGPGAGATLSVVADQPEGSLGLGPRVDEHVARDVRALLAGGITDVLHYGATGDRAAAELRVHIQSFAAAPRMVVIGANDFSAAVVPMAARMGYEVIVCDAREPFLRSPRFAPARIELGWPQEVLAGMELTAHDAVLVFTHDPKFDEPALIAALQTNAGYIGALGSRRTTADRNRRLRDAGVDAAGIARIFAPCGLDIGAATPAEASVAILAEVVAARTARSGGSLRTTEGDIRPDAATAAALGDRVSPIR
jgi:xanthine dehydrogenase accessory factor